MEVIRQREPHHCAVACLSMTTGIDYDDVVMRLGDALRHNGVSEMYLRQFLWDAGYSLRQVYQTKIDTGFVPRGAWPVAPFADRHIAYTRPHHWVVIDADRRVFDPNLDQVRKMGDYDYYTIIGLWPDAGSAR